MEEVRRSVIEALRKATAVDDDVVPHVADLVARDVRACLARRRLVPAALSALAAAWRRLARRFRRRDDR